jgi:hypothetical protein
MKLDDFVTRAGQLVALGDAVLATKSSFRDFPGSYVDKERFAEFRASSLSFIQNLYGTSHSYFSDFETRVRAAEPSDTQKGKGILQAIRNELAGGWLRTARGLIASELFADFLEMVEHLLNEGYKDPAAVLLGGVLEEHLRQLCASKGVVVVETKAGKVVPRKTDTLNADLTKAGAYKMLDQKNVTAWLELRNKAAHGRYTEYNAEQVRVMQSGVAEFIARTS